MTNTRIIKDNAIYARMNLLFIIKELNKGVLTKEEFDRLIKLAKHHIDLMESGKNLLE